MNILYLSHTPLYPFDNALGYLAYSTIKALHHEGHRCTLLSIAQSHEQLSTAFDTITVRTITIPPPVQHIAKTIRFWQLPYPFAWRSWYSSTYEETLLELVNTESFDLIHVDDIRILAYIEQIRLRRATPPVVTWCSSLLSTTALYQIQNEREILRKAVLLYQRSAIKRVEQRLLEQAHTTFLLNDHTPPALNNLRVKNVIPPLFTPSTTVKADYSNTLFSLLDLQNPLHIPSVEWLLGNILPLMEQYFPPHTWGTDYHLGGNNPPAHILQYDNPAEHLHLHPNPSSVIDFLSRYDIMIAPQPTSNGLAFNVLHAMAYGKAVIATSNTIQGIPCSHGENILVANTPKEFVQCIGLLLHDADLKSRIQTQALNFVKTHYNSTLPLIQAYEEVLT